MSPLKTVAPLPSLISMLCGWPASWLSNSIWKAWPAGAVSSLFTNAMFIAASWTTLPDGEPDPAADAAGPPDAPGAAEAPGAADAPGAPDPPGEAAAFVNSWVQQSGNGVAPAA